MSLVTTYAAESGHWYARDGTPAYEIVGKNGKQRATTLRDARTLDLVPSVTTIIRTMANPGLERWKREQMMLAALTLPRVDGESEQDFLRRVVEDSEAHAKAAAERGTRVHAAIEMGLSGRPFDLDDAPYVEAVREALGAEFGHQAWNCEKSFASEMGYGGKVDLSSQEWVIDFKTKEFGPDKTAYDLAYDEHVMQGSAYCEGMDIPYCANVFVSVSNPGLVLVKRWTQDEQDRGWEMFYACLKLWQLKNRMAS